MENVSHTRARAQRRRRGNNWTLSGTKSSRRKQRNSKFDLEEFNKSKREWIEYVRSLTLEDKRTLLVHIVHVLPDVTTPNRDLKSLKEGINWLKSCLEEGDKDAQSSAPTAVCRKSARKSAASPSLQTGGEHASSTCLQTDDGHVSPALTCGMENSSSLEDKAAGIPDSSITAATTLVRLHNQPSPPKKTKRQSVLHQRALDQARTKKRKENVNREAHTLTTLQRKVNKERRAIDMQSQQEKSNQLIEQKQRLKQLARELIDNKNFDKCTSLLMESETRAARCVQLMPPAPHLESFLLFMGSQPMYCTLYSTKNLCVSAKIMN